jgi:hypothetical protein
MTRLSGFLVSTDETWAPTDNTHKTGHPPHSMISYAPTEGGIGPHVDNYDVFLLQVGEN